MTVGTEGNDQLSNDTSKLAETVQALGGDDTITINPPPPGQATIFVDGGNGYDKLIIDAGSGTFNDMSLVNGFARIQVRVSSLNNYVVSQANIEEIDLTGRLFSPSFPYQLGGEIDIVHLTAGNAGNYLIQTNGGADQIFWTATNLGVNVTIDAGAGDDLIDFTGSVLGARIGQGGDGNDTLIGGSDVDRLEGGLGNDVLDGRGGADTMLGGAGDDIYFVDNAGDVVTENAGEGNDEVRTALASYTLGANVENLTGTSSGGQTLNGNGGDNHLTGGSGGDTLNGGGGNDVLDGGAGADTMTGGTGDDVYYVDDAGDTVNENPGEGTDEVRTSLASYTLGANVENLTGLVAGQTLNGNGDANVITAAPGNATLHGGAGDDVLKVTNPGFAQAFGDTGNDTLVADLSGATGGVGTLGGPSAGNPDGNYVVYAGGGVRVDADGIENFNIKTGSGDDFIVMGAGNDVADLGAGDDVLFARAGTIVADGGAGTDGINVDFSTSTSAIAIDLGAGTLTGAPGSSIVNFEYFQVYGATPGLATGSGDDVVVTTAVAKGDNIATGAGNDQVTVYNGNDSVNMGTGTDTLIVDWRGSTTGVGTQGFSTNTTDGGSDIVLMDQSGRRVDGFSVEKLVVTTGSGDDNFFTPNGDDVVNPGSGNDNVNTQGGNDRIIIDAAGAKNVQGGTGTDTLVIDYGSATQSVYANIGPNANGTQGGWDGEYYNNTDNSRVDYTSIERFDITTGSGSDTIVTKDGDDVVHAGGGDDVVDVGTGGDVADGGSGIDGISANMLDTTGAVVWNLQTNSFSNPGGPDSFTNFEYVGTVTTAGGDDVITTASGGHNETINTGGGNDTVTVVDGADRFNAGIGSDTLVIAYGSATQSVYANIGPNANGTQGGWDGEYYNNTDNSRVDYTSVERFDITTGSGNDTIVTKDGDDVVHAGAGDDVVDVGTGGDTADGGSGIDGISADIRDTTSAVIWNLQTNSFSNTGGPDSFTNFEYLGTVTTAGGDDVITTAAGGHNETVNTGGGNDTVTVVDGADRFNAGVGTDTLIVDYHTATQSVSANIGPNANAVDGGWDGEFYNNTDNSRVDYNSVENFRITTGSGNDTIVTKDGNDVVTLNGGDDFVDVGTGTDRADGGAGIDGISADLTDAEGPVVWNLQTNSFAGGPDSFTNFEYLGTITTAGGNDAITTASGGHNETINTGGGDDAVTVVDGADRVNAGTGTDTLVVDYSAATQSVITNIGPNANATNGGWDGEFYNNTDNSRVDYTSVERFVITTGSGNDTIVTKDGDDVVSLGNGDDFVDVGTGRDTADGGAGIDGISADLGDATTAVTWDLKSNSFSGTTDSFANFEYFGTITTGSGWDVITTTAGGHNERINTGAGNDRIKVVDGADQVNAGTGTDTLIIDYSAATQAVQTINGPSANAIDGGWNGQYWNTTDNSHVDYTSVDRFQILTGSGNDDITTADGGDLILTGAGDDNVHAGGGDDWVDGGAGNDTLDGGSGIDMLSYQSATSAVTVDLSKTAQQDTIGAGLDTISNFENLTGSAYDDHLTGNASDNLIDGGAGADAMAGGAGNDVYIVDDAGDTISEAANAGIDEVRTALNSYNYFATANLENLTFTGTGNFVGIGNGGDNVITAGAGNDQLYGNGGADTLKGAGGDDFLVGGAGNDVLDGGSGSDTAGYNGEGGPIGVTANLATGTATDSFGDTDTLIGIENIRGSAHDDVLTGDSGANALAGNGGDDVLDGGAGNDTLIGGTGDDVYYVDSTGDGVFELAGQGSDEIRTTLASFTLGVTAQSANVEALTGLLDTGQALTGDDKDNVITGGGGDDVLTGGGSSGGDYLDGGAGDDRLVVSTGLNSIVHGGGGTDTMVVQLGDQSDDITLGAPSEDPDGGYTGELRGAGDTVSIFFDGVEKLDITTGSGNDSITAGGGDDVIATGAGDDVIDGGAGADTMTGGTGDDVYYVDNAGDVVVENAGEGTDEIRTTLASYTLTTANVEKLTYVGTGDFHGTGGGNADTITGGAGDDVLDGAGGNDFLDLSAGGTDRAIGGAGNDAVYFGAAFGAGDSVDGGTGTDTVGLRGDYTGANAATIVAGAMTGVEVLNLMTSTGGTVGYEITWDNGNLADGQKMTIYAGNLASGENVVFDGSAETHGYFVMYGGLGDDDLTGGANSDGFYFGPGKFDQNDHVDGGGGTQNQLGLDGSYDFEASSALGTFGGNFTGIQTIVLYKGDARDPASFPNVYHIVTNDAAVAQEATLTIYGVPVISDLTFDGSAETDGAFRIFSGTGNDTLTGGHGNDLIWGNAGADTLTGGAGNDTFLYTNVAESAGNSADTITDFGAGDKIDLSQIDADTTQDGDQAFAFIGGDAFGHHAGELRAEFDQVNNVWTVQGDVDGDGQADFTLHVTTLGGHQIVATDFMV